MHPSSDVTPLRGAPRQDAPGCPHIRGPPHQGDPPQGFLHLRVPHLKGAPNSRGTFTRGIPSQSGAPHLMGTSRSEVSQLRGASYLGVPPHEYTQIRDVPPQSVPPLEHLTSGCSTSGVPHTWVTTSGVPHLRVSHTWVHHLRTSHLRGSPTLGVPPPQGVPYLSSHLRASPSEDVPCLGALSQGVPSQGFPHLRVSHTWVHHLRHAVSKVPPP